MMPDDEVPFSEWEARLYLAEHFGDLDDTVVDAYVEARRAFYGGDGFGNMFSTAQLVDDFDRFVSGR